MQVQKTIENKLNETFSPNHLEVINESHMHNVPEGSESHFRVIVVSDKFNGQSRIQRQRWVNEVLKQELAGPVHALSQRALTPEEWSKSANEFASPPCYGGSQHD